MHNLLLDCTLLATPFDGNMHTYFVTELLAGKRARGIVRLITSTCLQGHQLHAGATAAYGAMPHQ